jgi:hypothetical protein
VSRLDFLRSPWITIAVVAVGGLTLGLGIGRMLERPDVLAAVYGVLGVVLLWWGISDYRKTLPGAPESEADGSHTIE